MAALAARRKDCGIVCAAVVASAAADAAKRTALSALVRYATPKAVQRPGDLRTPGVAALDGKRTGLVMIHHEHVVPVRLLVDRMLSGNSPAVVLRSAVVAHVLAVEHAAIGPLVKQHADLYSRMKKAPLRDLPLLARERYTASGLQLVNVPEVLDPANLLEVR